MRGRCRRAGYDSRALLLAAEERLVERGRLGDGDVVDEEADAALG